MKKRKPKIQVKVHTEQNALLVQPLHRHGAARGTNALLRASGRDRGKLKIILAAAAAINVQDMKTSVPSVKPVAVDTVRQSQSPLPLRKHIPENVDILENLREM